MQTSKKVLVVDDERGIRSLLLDLLSGQGFDVSMAKDGEESLAHLATGSFDLVITDICMPRLDGIEMLKWMKKSGRREKVIVMSGDPGDRRLHEADIPPLAGLFHKPFKLEKFLNAVVAVTAMKGVGACGETQIA